MKETIDLLARLVKEVGFPIVIASVLLYYLITQTPLMRDTIARQTTATENVTRAIDGLVTQQDELSDLIRGERKVQKSLIEELKEGNPDGK